MVASHESLAPPERRPQVVVVDDDEARCELFARLLRHDGYEVATFRDGETALDAVREHPPDLILLDVRLPRSCGFEICGDLRMMDEARLIPVILVSSAEYEEEAVVRGLLCGADDYVVTPHRLTELRARVRVQLRNRRDRELLQIAKEQRAHLRRQALLDPLTQIANRRAGEEALDEALSSGDPLTVLVVDIDHFKAVNDTHGHPAGDAVLREVAQRLAACARRGDTVARIGGEEFLVVLPGCGPDSAVAVGERFRRAVSAAQASIPTTVSVGVRSRSVDCATRAQLLRDADQALYEAKRRGRDRVVSGNDGGGS